MSIKRYTQSLTQIETQRKLKLPSKVPIYAEKYAICALCWKMRQYATVAYSHKNDMPMCAWQIWSRLLSPVSESVPRAVNLFMAVPTIYAKLIDNYDERMNKGPDSNHTKDYIKTTCSSKIRYFRLSVIRGYSCSFFVCLCSKAPWAHCLRQWTFLPVICFNRTQK